MIVFCANQRVGSVISILGYLEGSSCSLAFLNDDFNVAFFRRQQDVEGGDRGGEVLQGDRGRPEGGRRQAQHHRMREFRVMLNCLVIIISLDTCRVGFESRQGPCLSLL